MLVGEAADVCLLAFTVISSIGAILFGRVGVALLETGNPILFDRVGVSLFGTGDFVDEIVGVAVRDNLLNLTLTSSGGCLCLAGDFMLVVLVS